MARKVEARSAVCALPSKKGTSGEGNDHGQYRKRGECRPGAALQRAHHRQARLQPLACPARRPVHPPVHRHGLRLLGVLEAAAGRPPRCRRQGATRMLARRRHLRREIDRHFARADRHRLQLEPVRPRLDVHVLLRAARRLGRHLGRLAGARRPAQGGIRLGAVLVRRPAAGRARRLHPPTLADVDRRRRHRRHRPRPRLHLTCLYPHQVVPRPPRHGDRHGHHGLRRRRHDRLAACHHPDERL